MGEREKGEATERDRERETGVGEKERETGTWTQSRVGAIPRGRNPVWAQSLPYHSLYMHI